MKRLATLLLPLLLAACASTPKLPVPPAPSELFADGTFAAPSEPVTTAKLFDMSESMKSYLRSGTFAEYMRTRGAEQALVDLLYSKGQLKLEYDSTLTRTAAQTFEAKSGNCLSLVIMTAAFAKELNMQVFYQNVIVEETFTRNGSLMFASTHVNLTIGRRSHDYVHGYDPQRVLTIDFIPPAEAAKYRTQPLDEETVMAMYMNNRAAEALAANRIDDAYWWARQSVKQHPQYITAFNTLGVVYQRRGDNARAENVFREGLRRAPGNLVIQNNLVPVLAALGKHEESKALAEKLAKIEPHPPFYFYDEGIKALKGGNDRLAKEMFQREVDRAPYNAEFHFWLAVAHHRLGESKPAREQMLLAAETSTTVSDRGFYSNKLSILKAGSSRQLR
jgi:Tfp pilus assembly protein PilF